MTGLAAELILLHQQTSWRKLSMFNNPDWSECFYVLQKAVEEMCPTCLRKSAKVVKKSRLFAIAFFSRSRNWVNRSEVSQIQQKMLEAHNSFLSLSLFARWKKKKKKRILTKKPVGPDLIMIAERSRISSSHWRTNWKNDLLGYNDRLRVASCLIWV